MTKTKQKAETRKKLLGEFLNGFEGFLAHNGARVRMTADRKRGENWIRPCNVGARGFNLVAAHWGRKNEVSATLRITEETGRRFEFFDLLEAQKVEIEREMGMGREMCRELTWERTPQERKPPKKRGEGPIPKIYLRQDADLYDKEAWPHQYAWLLAGLEDLHRVFEDRIRNLPT